MNVFADGLSVRYHFLMLCVQLPIVGYGACMLVTQLSDPTQQSFGPLLFGELWLLILAARHAIRVFRDVDWAESDDVRGVQG